jgi:rubrerythrin
MDDCPMCDGSGLMWVASGNDGDVAREQCPICDQLKRKENEK